MLGKGKTEKFLRHSQLCHQGEFQHICISTSRQSWQCSQNWEPTKVKVAANGSWQEDKNAQHKREIQHQNHSLVQWKMTIMMVYYYIQNICGHSYYMTLH